MFVKFDCGCIGVHQEKEEAIIILACDEDRDRPRDSLSWSRRDMTEKTFTPLSKQRELDYHFLIGQRLAKADRFDEIRLALGIDDNSHR